jgi:hypothetical protein
MNARLQISATLALVVALSGCGEGPSSDTANVGNKAVNKTLPTLKVNLLAQSTNISPSITNGVVVPNANAMQANVNQAVPLGGALDDGTSADATVVVTTTPPTESGGNTITMTVSDTASGDVFLDATVVNDNGVIVGFRLPPYGYDALAADGTGQAFIIASLDWLGSTSRTYVSQTVGGLTLVDLAAFPAVADGLLQGTFARYEEYLVEYDIVDNAGELEAHVVRTTQVAHGFGFRRSGLGAPNTTMVGQSFSQVDVGGFLADLTRDVVIPVGTDADPLSPFTDTTSLTVDFSVIGGVVSGDLASDFGGAINPIPATNITTSVNYTGNLAASVAEVNNGTIETDERVVMTTSSIEDSTPAGDVVHSVDALLAPFADLEDLLYLTSQAEQESSLFIFR